MMVSVEEAGKNRHVVKHHQDDFGMPCPGHSMALLTGPGSTTFELGQDTGIFITVEWRPTEST